MSENKHTPGPWSWWTSNSWKRLKHDVAGLTLNVLEPYVCRDGHPDLTVSEADMRLIAAAPQLLDELKHWVASCPNCGGSGERPHSFKDCLVPCEKCSPSRTAIAMATGR